MKIKPLKISAVASTIILLIITLSGVSHAWFKAFDQGSDDSAMGLVDITISDKSDVGHDGSLDFRITNHSEIDTYIRSGWTPVIYQDGRATTKDTSGISIYHVQLSKDAQLSDLNYRAEAITSFNGYQKNMINMVDNDGQYFVVPAQTDIEGTIQVNGWQPNEGETLHLILIPEAIQATQKAVEAAEAYGWQPDRVGAQAGTIVTSVQDGKPEGGD